jgi:quercetin dioxygenase-like cupin family protein
MEKKTRSETAEVDVPSILKKDGVVTNNFQNENLPLVNLQELIDKQDNSRSWSYRIINTENNSATLISQMPGEGNRLHYHPEWNEWWYIVKGEWDWEIEGTTHRVRQGEIVFIEKKKLHKITATGTGPAIRLAVSKDLVPHVYPSDESANT